jgi:hypothetical protein
MPNPGSALSDFQARHHPIYSREQLGAAVTDINNRINGCGFYFAWDMGSERGYTSYEALPEGVVMVISSFDFSYYYDLEMAFHSVVKHDLEDEYPWPDHWSKDQIELLSEDEASRFMQQNGIPATSGLHLFALNIGSHSDNQFYILAKGFSYYFGTVFYYDRTAQEHLTEGQRVAWWVSEG